MLSIIKCVHFVTLYTKISNGVLLFLHINFDCCRQCRWFDQFGHTLGLQHFIPYENSRINILLFSSTFIVATTYLIVSFVYIEKIYQILLMFWIVDELIGWRETLNLMFSSTASKFLCSLRMDQLLFAPFRRFKFYPIIIEFFLKEI